MAGLPDDRDNENLEFLALRKYTPEPVSYTHLPDMLDIPSTARSPQQMFGSIAKSYWAEKMGIPREKLVVVSIMPCLAKKYECARDEFKVNVIPDVDYSISTRELARLIKRANIGFPLVLDSPFDNP